MKKPSKKPVAAKKPIAKTISVKAKSEQQSKPKKIAEKKIKTTKTAPQKIKKNVNPNKLFNVAIVGVTGAVGEAFLEILEQREFPVAQLYALASKNSAGETVSFNNKSILVQDTEGFDFSEVDIALFSAGTEVSAKYAPIAAKAGCVVIDNSPQFRNDKDVPLVVPEVNPEALADYYKLNIIANPNCSTIQMVVALKPIYDAVGITRINVATYQSVSGSGKLGIDELAEQTMSLLNGNEAKKNIYPKQIAFNLIPQIDTFEENGYTREEMKMVWETKKIFNDDKIMVNPTAVRVPVFYCHSEAIHIETRDKITAKEAKKILKTAPGIIMMDKDYPTPIAEANAADAVYVGRIREDISHPRALNMWVVADNVRKGAALNAIEIAELLIKDYL